MTQLSLTVFEEMTIYFILCFSTQKLTNSFLENVTKRCKQITWSSHKILFPATIKRDSPSPYVKASFRLYKIEATTTKDLKIFQWTEKDEVYRVPDMYLSTQL